MSLEIARYNGVLVEVQNLRGTKLMKIGDRIVRMTVPKNKAKLKLIKCQG